MEGTSYAKEAAVGFGKMLADHKGGEVVVLDLEGLNAWTDCFVIATVTSSAHLRGLQRHVKEHAAAIDLEILRRHRKVAADDEWNLVDMGGVVVHLMTQKARAFYDLERLWSGARVLWSGPRAAPSVGA